MSLVDDLINEAEGDQVVYMEFISEFSRYDIFLFFEGKDDYLYYGSVLRSFYKGRKQNHYICQGKENVIKVYEFIKRSTKLAKNKKLLYFVDKDYDDNSDIPKEIYVTPCYSIENLFITDEAIVEIVKGTMGFNGFKNHEDYLDYESAVEYLKSSRDIICQEILYANACYYLQKNKAKYCCDKPDLSKMKKYNQIKGLKNYQEVMDLIPNFVEVNENEIEHAIKYLQNEPEKLIRGKYFRQAMPLYLNNMFEDSNKRANWKYFRKRRLVTLGKIEENTLISNLTQYAEVPDCLSRYINTQLG
ncbi:MAG: DUF4435 domain-containing protein [Peptostreptococcaceae bacterium]|nr:DUF4435 domain-containing protein [Peptostreptococcaceae bacterium]